MKVYVLSGSSNVGKTNTLHRLAILMNGMSAKHKLDAAIITGNLPGECWK